MTMLVVTLGVIFLGIGLMILVLPQSARWSLENMITRRMMPLYSIMYDRAGKPYRIISVIGKWSEDSKSPANKGKFVINGAHILIVNVQNKNSHAIQFDNTNAGEFTVSESKKYYDTTKLKRRGR